MEFRFNNLKNINTTRYLDDCNFGNHFFYSMALHTISQTNNLLSSYKEYKTITDLGIELFIGTRIYTKNLVINDENFFNLLFVPIQPSKNIILNSYFQTKEFALYLYDYFNEDIQKNRIISHNIYKNRYQHNNDIFIHIKILDLIFVKDPFEYYDKILSTNIFDNGYISSDNITNPLCQRLINKYNLIHINYDIGETIMFGSTCNKVILSKGATSWLIGILAFYSTVYYPQSSRNFKSNIFDIPEWVEIDTSKN